MPRRRDEQEHFEDYISLFPHILYSVVCSILEFGDHMGEPLTVEQREDLEAMEFLFKASLEGAPRGLQLVVALCVDVSSLPGIGPAVMSTAREVGVEQQSFYKHFLLSWGACKPMFFDIAIEDEGVFLTTAEEAAARDGLHDDVVLLWLFAAAKRVLDTAGDWCRENRVRRPRRRKSFFDGVQLTPEQRAALRAHVLDVTGVELVV